ncbi:MAG TPA: DUF222 domain-containing protein [Kofleriaceae bacterium]
MNELEQLGERIAEQAAHLDAAMHRFLTDLREFDQRGGWHQQGARTCAHWLAWRVGWDLVTSRERVRVAGKLAEFPTIDDALRRGEMSYSKVRAMLRVATPANEVLLLEHARLMTASQLETLCRKYAVVQRHGRDPHPVGDEQRRYVRRRDTDNGMVKIEAVLHPEEAELVWTMLNHAATQLAREPDRSARDDSAESWATAPATATATASPPAAVVVTSPLSDLADLNSDSAESRPQPEAPTSTATTSSISGRYFDTCPIDDSAESRLHASPSDATAPGSLVVLAASGDFGTCPTNDSSKSLPHDAVTDAVAPVIPKQLGTCPTDGSAESPSPEFPRRSLLDRLLDQADALRIAEGGMRGETEAPSSTGEAPSNGQAAARTPGRLQQRADAAMRAFNRADALLAVAQQYLRGDRPNRSPIEIVLTIPESSLRAGAADPLETGEMGESFVSSETARRLSCDAGVVEIIEDECGTPLSVGRKRRTVAGALKRALRKRDTICCYPGCTNRMFLEGHHIKHWVDGGETSLRNSALLCSAHHRYAHEYGYAIELGPDQRPRFRDPHGRLVAQVPERPVIADLGWPRLRAENVPLSITADTIACGWDGTAANYGEIVGHLLVADGIPGSRASTARCT